MPKALQPATHDRADEISQAEDPDDASVNNGGPSGVGTSSRRGSRTVSACEQCQRRKTKCTGQPSPCEACTKNNLACHFDMKPNMRSRVRAAYSAEDDRLQYLLNAVLHALKYGDPKALESLTIALRQNEPPEVVAMHLRNNMSALQEQGHIPNMTIDQADLTSLASRINNPAISSRSISGFDADDEVYPYHVNTADPNAPPSEPQSLTPIEQYSQQEIPISDRASNSLADMRRNYATSTQSTFSQAAGGMTWEPSFQQFTDNSNQLYPPDQYGAQIHGIMPTNAMYQQFHVGPYTVAQTTSNYDQYYPVQQDLSTLTANTGMFETSQYTDPNTMSTLPTMHEDLSAQNFSQSSSGAAGQPALFPPGISRSPTTPGPAVMDNRPRQYKESFEQNTDRAKRRPR